MYNEQTNAHLIDSSVILFFITSLPHVSTPKLHPQGAVIRCLPSCINVFMQTAWSAGVDSSRTDIIKNSIIKLSIKCAFLLDIFPTRCNITQLFISGKLLYMFRVVSPPIIRSTHNCIYSIWYLLNRYCYLPLLRKSWNWFECGVGIVLICFGAVAPHQ